MSDTQIDPDVIFIMTVTTIEKNRFPPIYIFPDVINKIKTQKDAIKYANSVVLNHNAIHEQSSPESILKIVSLSQFILEEFGIGFVKDLIITYENDQR